MKISYNWLQSYFDERLPTPEVLADRITFSLAEIESLEKFGDDHVFDVNILPDRACYALSHRGIAYDVSAILGIDKKEMNWPQPEIQPVRGLEVKVENPNLCKRYTTRVIENIKQKENSWVKDHLESVGQRSINPIVDGSNLVMFDMGQPLHAFDADKVKGQISVRMAKNGEKITTLDNKEVDLDESILVIADEEGPLAIAGIKGGTKALVGENTKNIILESANFDASYIRMASEKIGIRTDSSKRFENKISPSMTEIGLRDFTAFLYEMDKGIKVGEVIDIYTDKQNVESIETTYDYLAQKIGCGIDRDVIRDILLRLHIDVKDEGEKITLKPPYFRLDLIIKEDIAEEIGRLYGYEKIPTILPPSDVVDIKINKQFYWEWKIRSLLADEGFSEVMTSSFVDRGKLEIMASAIGKNFLRNNLLGIGEGQDVKSGKIEISDVNAGLLVSMSSAKLNAPFLGLDKIKIFEIGNVFGAGEEETHFAFAIWDKKGKKQIIRDIESVFENLAKEFNIEKDDVPVIKELSGENFFEINLSALIEKLSEPKKWDIEMPKLEDKKFKPFSQYPFIVRDIALFVSSETRPEVVAEVIKENAGDLVVRGPELFDEFEKEGKKSLAFRMVFQSFEKTLSDEEINKVMEGINAKVIERGWEVR